MIFAGDIYCRVELFRHLKIAGIFVELNVGALVRLAAAKLVQDINCYSSLVKDKWSCNYPFYLFMTIPWKFFIIISYDGL